MKKRIIVLILCVLVIGQAVTLISAEAGFRATYQSEMAASLQGGIRAMELSLGAGNTDYAQAAADYQKAFGQNIRVTFIESDGAVLADTLADPVTMGNHAEREEIAQAGSGGFGMAVRKSESTGVETIYMAKQMENGVTLRLAFPMENTYAFIRRALPVVFIVLFGLLAAAMVFSGLLSKGILAPMRQLHGSIQDYLSGEDTTFRIESNYEETEEIAVAFSELARRINLYIVNIKKEQKKSAMILDNIREGLMVLDKDQDVLLANAAALRIFRMREQIDASNIMYYTRDPNVLKNIDDAFSLHKNTYFDYADAEAGKTYRFYFTFVSEDAFVKGEDGLLLLITDITETALADKVRHDFAANVSHELKTPLTSITGYAQLIANGMTKDETASQKYAQCIIDESDRLMGLINDTLALSELENIQIDEATETVDLQNEMRYVQNILSSAAGEKNMEIKVTGGAKMTANKNRIRQLLLNLCDNAVKYGRKDSEVSVLLEQGENGVTVTVTDAGIGIPEDEQGRVFERFYRAKNAGGATVPGTGLGLAIVKHIAQLYGGEVSLQSSPEEGSAFTVRMKR